MEIDHYVKISWLDDFKWLKSLTLIDFTYKLHGLIDICNLRNLKILLKERGHIFDDDLIVLAKCKNLERLEIHGSLRVRSKELICDNLQFFKYVWNENESYHSIIRCPNLKCRNMWFSAIKC